MNPISHHGFQNEAIHARSFIKSVTQAGLFQSINLQLEERFSTLSFGDIVVVAFRPWADRIKNDDFTHEERAEKYDNLMLAAISSEVSERSLIIFHGDNRARQLSSWFYDRLKAARVGAALVETTSMLPGHFNMDVVICALADIAKVPIRVMVFDTSLSIPFVEAGFNMAFVTGITGEILDGWKELRGLRDQLRRRYEYWRRYEKASQNLMIQDADAETYIVQRPSMVSGL